MDIYCSVFVALLAILFFLILFLGIRRKSYSFKMVKAENDRNIEAKLRLLMHKNPRCEIVVISRSKSGETREILRKMEYDFPEIHIVTY